MTFFRSLILVLSLASALSAQVRRPVMGRGNTGGPVIDAVASFDGVFKAAEKSFIEIQVESGDIMRMYLTHGTKFIRDGKNVKVSDFHNGDLVTADATRDARMNLVAVSIASRKPEDKKPDDKNEDKKGEDKK
jgi:hypothetical protein